MTDVDYARWLAANDHYLGEYLGWLRGRLAALAADVPVAPAPVAAPQGRRRRGRAVMVEDTTAHTPTPPTLPDTVRRADELELAPPLVQLARRLGLSVFERHVLALCAAMELDTGVAAMCARAQRDPNRAYPTFALAMSLFDDPSWEAMSPERPLRYWQLVTLSRRDAEALTTTALRIDERVAHYIKGLNHLDDRIRAVTIPLPAGSAADLAPSQSSVTEHLVRELERADPAVLQLVGGDGVSKRLVAAQAAARVGLGVFEMPADALPSDGSELDLLARLWRRETALSPVVLYLNVSDVEQGSAGAATLRRWMSHDAGAVFFDVDDPWPDAGVRSRTVDVARPSTPEQLECWTDALAGHTGAAHARRLADQFNFNLPTIREIVADVPDRAGPGLWAACLAQSRPSLERLAQRIEPRSTWDDIKLADEDLDLLHQIADQVAHRGTVYDRYGFRERMNRGLGISVLFAGESGTGKTMAAEVIADDLGLCLYRIDLSAVVSKYIGETEKNLRKLFDAADSGGAILFFDEADALFGKRSEVKDSHDRYANIEINYLLQRMENYRGLAILATNMKSAMDTAFLRRLRFIVTFGFPAAAERTAIWHRAFPLGVPRAELDFDRLARLNLTGGAITNIAVNAAFLAARDGGAVTMPLVLAAARTELRKMDRPINEADFRWLERAGDSA